MQITKEIAYILGFIWADGCVEKAKNGNWYRLSIECVASDLETIKDIFLSVPVKWNISQRTRKHWKPQMCFRTSDREFCQFLLANDYHVKSSCSAEKILSQIHPNLHLYFFRGLCDGDGCFYVEKKLNKTTIRRPLMNFTIASSFSQDWTYCANLCNSLGIEFTVRRSVLKKSRSTGSTFSIQKPIEIIKFGDYIYQNYELDKIGFPRKYEKYNLMCNSITEQTIWQKEESLKNDLLIKKLIEENVGIHKMARILHLSTSRIRRRIIQNGWMTDKYLPQKKIPENVKNAVVSHYNNGLCVSDIERATKLSRNYILTVLNMNGIFEYTGGGAKRTNPGVIKLEWSK